MSAPGAVMTCPKCSGPMTSYERNNVLVDQCRDCRGIFLDRGELDQLMDAENRFYQGNSPGYPAPYPPDHHDRGGYRQDTYRKDSYRHDKRRKRGGFLSELFDAD